MKAIFKALPLAGAMMSFSAMAVFDPSWERPIESAEMKVLDATGAFEDAEEVVLTVTRRDGQEDLTGIQISYLMHHPVLDVEARQVTKDLVIVSRYQDSCGSTHFVATLKHDENTIGGERFSVRLENNSNRHCEDYRAPWVASVQQGASWWSTINSTMELNGTPEGVYTIQGLPSVQLLSLN